MRHPKICKFYRNYQRCKFGEWCFFKHIENNDLENIIIKEEIMEKLDNLTRLIEEKDVLIHELAERIKVLEENQDRNEVTIDEKDDDETEINQTFANPYLVIKCENCDFVAKTNGGLQVHLRAKHKELLNKTDSSEQAVEDSVQCDQSGVVIQNESEKQEHRNLEHENEREEIEIKLEVFTLVDIENDVLEARKKVMDKLKEQSDVESVKTVYVSKNDSFFDIDDLRWNTIEIVITSKKNETTWKDKKFRKSLFSKC